MTPMETSDILDKSPEKIAEYVHDVEIEKEGLLESIEKLKGEMEAARQEMAELSQ